MELKKVITIISGGQTGADRAAFDFALELGFEIGGFVPKNRRAEDGKIPETYPNLIETPERDYKVRTELNVLNSDATLIVSHGKFGGGSLFTKRCAVRHKKPFLHLDFDALSIEAAAGKTQAWLKRVNCRKLNVAGPRASTDAEIYDVTKRFLAALFEVK